MSSARATAAKLEIQHSPRIANRKAFSFHDDQFGCSATSESIAPIGFNGLVNRDVYHFWTAKKMQP